ncbi:MAG: hypothetical protein IIA87_00945 [Nanoarchaeota archaeon]|nr:hypothetical protein [Nanoarchaeota archaeon]
MVHKIVDNRYRIFVESLLITFIIFIIGFSVGFFVESYRTDKIIDSYRDYEVEALDLKLQNYYYQIMSRSSCDVAIEQNFIFADKLYNDGLIIERYEEASQITDNVEREKKRYVLLKTELWLNTLLLKEKCDNPFDTIVYFYTNDPSNNIVLSQQKIISNVLKDIKEDKGNSVILLPIAGDLGLESVDLQMRIYNVTSLPSILINEEILLEGFHTVEEIESYLR